MKGRHGILLAAGAGTRFGGGKLTADWRGAPLVVWAARAALAARVERVTVVLGARADQVRAALTVLTDERLHFVVARDWALGQSASLKAGIRALPGDATGFAVFLGDMPAVDPGLADRLLDAIEAGAPAARAHAPTGPAHPAAFSTPLIPELLALGGDQGGRAVFDRLGDESRLIETDDPGAVLDIDRRSDLS
jgi:molybdenum cofactor cytidylyltransferase